MRKHTIDLLRSFLLLLGLLQGTTPFLASTTPCTHRRASTNPLASSTTAAASTTELATQKKKLLNLLRTDPQVDPVLADPITKEPLCISTKSTLLGGYARTRLELTSPTNTYEGSSDTYLNLLEPIKVAPPTNASSSSSSSSSSSDSSSVLRNVLVSLIPPPLRAALAGVLPGNDDNNAYVPMRDLFTSPSVSFAYERGWRQGFARAGFPGPDAEAAMAMEYFSPSMLFLGTAATTTVVVDMSCATGLFTRRFAASGKYQRVLGCDYSDSMLHEARRRIRADAALQKTNTKSKNTQVDLVRLDVGQIPMQTASVQALHAGAAMHCWPDLPAAVSEIYRVLQPGGRYFATTFLSSYFRMLQPAEEEVAAPSRQAFQYFASIEQLRDLLMEGGFAREKILIEVLGNACVVIRCEK